MHRFEEFDHFGSREFGIRADASVFHALRKGKCIRRVKRIFRRLLRDPVFEFFPYSSGIEIEQL